MDRCSMVMNWNSIFISVFSKLVYRFSAIQLKFHMYSMCVCVCVCVIVYKLIK